MCMHRLHQVATSKLDVRKKYQLLSHFQNAVNKRISFRKTLLSISNCSAFVPKAGENWSGMNRAAAIVSPPPHEHGQLDEDVTVAHAPITTEMPKRNALKQYQQLDEMDEKISDAPHRRVLEHRKTCIGQLIPSKTRGTCPVCLKTCKEYYVLCHLSATAIMYTLVQKKRHLK
jgi:hypothetical protein